MSENEIFRIVSADGNGKLQYQEYLSESYIPDIFPRIGFEDCSTDLNLRGKPLFQGLIGPIPEPGNVLRYETPEVFEFLTKEWSSSRKKKHRRRKL